MYASYDQQVDWVYKDFLFVLFPTSPLKKVKDPEGQGAPSYKVIDKDIIVAFENDQILVYEDPGDLPILLYKYCKEHNIINSTVRDELNKVYERIKLLE